MNWSYSSTTSGRGSTGGAGGAGFDGVAGGSDFDTAAGGPVDGGEELVAAGEPWVDSAISSSREVAASSLRAM